MPIIRRPFVRRTVTAVAALVAVLLLAAAGSILSRGFGVSASSGGVDTAAAPASGGEAGQSVPDEAGENEPQAVPDGSQIVRTLDLGIRVASVPEAATRVRTIVGEHGGYVSDERVASRGYGTITARIPAVGVDATVEAMSGVGTLESRMSRAEDVSGTLSDMETRIAAQRASLARLSELMSKAGSVSEIATVEREVTSRQADLDALLARQARLADKVAMATVTVTLSGTSTTQEPSRWSDLWERVGDQVAASVEGLVMLVAVLAPYALLVGVAWWVIARIRRRGRGTATTVPDTRPDEGPADSTSATTP